MSKKNRNKVVGTVEQMPVVETSDLTGVLERDAAMTGDNGKQENEQQPDNGSQDSENQNRGQQEQSGCKRIISWQGQAVPHKCPECGAMVLLDRYTKACRVTTTRAERMDDHGSIIRDRDMECLSCHSMFIARESVM